MLNRRHAWFSAVVGLTLLAGCQCNVAPGTDAGGGGAGGGVVGSSGGGGVTGGIAGGVAGGVAGGSVGAGGGVVGGSAGGAEGGLAGGLLGGSAGGGGGGASGGAGGGSVLSSGVWVCAACPGASDSNPGTQAQPVRTVGQGIRLAVQTALASVNVAATYAGAPMAHTEDVTLAPGITVQGRWEVNPLGPTLSWRRTSTLRSVVVNTATDGLKSPAGLTRSAGIDGLELRQGIGAGRVAGATITGSSPRFADFAVTSSPNSNIPAESVGIDVLAQSSPRLEGGQGRSMVQPGSGTSSSVGIVVANSVLDLDGVDATGSGAPISRGIHLQDAPGSRIANSAAAASGASRSCVAVYSLGLSQAITLDQVSATGCLRGGSQLSTLGVGVVFEGCRGLTAPTPPTVRNSTLIGGVVSGTGSLVVGALAVNGCPVSFESNNIIGGFQLGAPGAPEVSAGLLCGRGIGTALGADSVCRVRGNQIVGGIALASGTVVGLQCEGSCERQGTACRGSCGEVAENSILAPSGNVMVHVRVLHSSPVLFRNRLGTPTGGVTVICLPGALVAGLELTNSSSEVSDNFILGGPCPSAVGVVHNFGQRVGAVASPTFHSNTIVAGGDPSNPTASTSIGASLNAGNTATPSGVWRNNIIMAGPVQGSGTPVVFAFREQVGDADPVELSNNLFFVVGGGGNPPLYLNEGASTLRSDVAINALFDVTSRNNQSVDPLLADPATGDLHISPRSPARGQGSMAGVPPVDIDGQVRPDPQPSAPDIGADEVP